MKPVGDNISASFSSIEFDRSTYYETRMNVETPLWDVIRIVGTMRQYVFREMKGLS